VAHRIARAPRPPGGRHGEIVAAALTAHAPLITGKPEVGQPAQRDRLYAGFREIGRRLQAARPDMLVMFVNDHLQNFAYSNLLAFCVGLAPTYQCPSPGGATLMRLEPRTVRGNSAWAMELLEAGLDFACSYEIESWGELSVPLSFLMPDGDVPIVTVYTNCAAPPLPSPRRCREIGAFVGDHIRGRGGSERIAQVATGGLSHWVGTPETGRINP
jgi:catalytic LigB subunit of aromatic ring-opening dioxygenase